MGKFEKMGFKKASHIFGKEIKSLQVNSVLCKAKTWAQSFGYWWRCLFGLFTIFKGLDFPSIKVVYRDNLGSPVVKTPSFQCRGCGFNPWLEDKDPTCCKAWPEKKKSCLQVVPLAPSPLFSWCVLTDTYVWSHQLNSWKLTGCCLIRY